MEKETRKLNPEYEVVSQGYNLKWLPNPNYPEHSLQEEIKIAVWDHEFVETWYWLIYQGKSKNYKQPDNAKKIWKHYPEGSSYYSTWNPEPNSWRVATDKEVETIKDYLKKSKFWSDKTYTIKTVILETKRTEKEVSSLPREIDIPISFIFILDNGWIVKRWRELYSEKI